MTRSHSLALSLACALTVTTAVAATATSLFAPIPDVPERENLASFIVQERAVTVDASLLGDPAAESPAGAESFAVDLFDETVTALRERVVVNPSGSLTWIGHVEGDLMSKVVLVGREGIVQGSIRTGGRMFDLRRVDARYQVLQEIDEDSPLLREDTPTTPTADRLMDGTSNRVPADDGSVIEILVLYTPAAMTSAGGTPNDIEARIELGVAETNISYGNTGIDSSIHLLHIEPVDYVEAASSQTDRNRLRIDGDGFLDEAHGWRDTWGADIVHMITATGCGISHIMSTVDPDFEEFAFCVTAEVCISPNYTFAHEMGHIQSARHDYAADPTNNAPYTYNHGYNDQQTSLWRTVMSYNNCPGGPCTRSLYWSNPDIDHPVTGTAMGIPEGLPQAADNRGTLNNTAFTVANFRTSTGQIFSDGFESGDTTAWSATIP